MSEISCTGSNVYSTFHLLPAAARGWVELTQGTAALPQVGWWAQGSLVSNYRRGEGAEICKCDVFMFFSLLVTGPCCLAVVPPLSLFIYLLLLEVLEMSPFFDVLIF